MAQGVVSLLVVLFAIHCAAQEPSLIPNEAELTVEVAQMKHVSYRVTADIKADIIVTLNTTESNKNIKLSSKTFKIFHANKTGTFDLTGLTVTSLTILDVQSCRYEDGSLDAECPLNIKESFLRVKVVHSNALSIVIIVVGWMYFVAWSISFYPQIYLNFKRSSVVGLNFDFLCLNIIGFTCYTIYNVLMYFDDYIQVLYHRDHPRSLNPVLLNDVVFASHALFACIVTAVQCFFYERSAQRVSYICIGLSSVFVLFSAISLIISVVDVISWLQFINNLSYVKMAVTLCKYVPQGVLNYRRKSTIGWSIGNVLLDFAGGSMDICQMILQAVNTDDWSGFYGNPVKFGLGLVSIVFDVFFMVQHYCLYRHVKVNDAIYEGINNSATSASLSQGSAEAGNAESGAADYGTSSSIPVRENHP